MVFIHHLLNAISLLILLSLSLQVDIVLEWWSESLSYFDEQISVRCANTPPGACCKPQPEAVFQLLQRRAGRTIFYHLRHNQFGAGWGAHWYSSNNADIFRCGGSPILRVYGPTGGSDDSVGIHNPPWGEGIDGTPVTIVYAATWIDLRTRFPPDSAGSRYLQWQGVKGAIWAKDTWNAQSDGIPFPKRKREHILDRYLYAEKGVVNVSAPTRWVYPTVYTINGTEYVEDGNGAYVSKDGKKLNLKNLVAR